MYPDVKRIEKHVALPDLDRIAREMLAVTTLHKVIIFNGEMGAGKTTFIKAIGRALGVTDTMSSPTFSIVNEYQTATRDRIFHFDFYRIKNEAEAYDIGTEEYFDSGHYCFVEWPDKIKTLLPEKFTEVSIARDTDQPTTETRTITFTIHD
jgi:tRNA threonylcarbamoyladenosine biosynthesis protein TsaE